MRAQAAFEYLAIVGIVLAFLIPIWLYVTSLQNQTATQLSLSYAKNAADTITDKADLVFSQGPPARIETQVYIPKNVVSVEILDGPSGSTGSTIVFHIRVGTQISDVSSTSNAQLQGSVPAKEGKYRISIEAADSHVEITEIT